MLDTGTLSDRSPVEGLILAALSPGLRSILLFDADPVTLRSLAEALKSLLRVVDGPEVEQVWLGTTESEDDLWGTLTLPGKDDKIPIAWKPGLLEQSTDQPPPRLVLIPNLARMSLAASRACVTLMGADVAHIERYGRQKSWKPNLCWLAGCNSNEVGQISSHLMDRFVLRLTSQHETSDKRVAQVLAWIYGSSFAEQSTVTIPLTIYNRLQKAISRWSEVTPEAIERVLQYFPLSETYYPRRAITLARLAHASARLEGTPMAAVHVDTAAQIINLRTTASQSLDASPSSNSVKPSKREHIDELLASNPLDDYFALQQEHIDDLDSPTTPSLIYQPDTATAFVSSEMPDAHLAKSATPYLEDDAPIEHEIASLQLPQWHYRTSNSAIGPIIGTMRATSTHDLALVSTILEAAKFQAIRRVNGNVTNGRLLLSPTDLRSYRRAPTPEQMLMLLLDYTCTRDCPWEEDLLHYIRWAYVERASMCLIQVGGINAKHELRAERLLFKNILDPDINMALGENAGRASPLAHGLDLALQTLQHTMQHGRSSTEHVVFVVLTDGRGNVPLESSRAGLVGRTNSQRGVQRRGIDDALEIAHILRSLKRVQIVLLNPLPRQYSELPLELASALGASVTSIKSPSEIEEDE